MNIQFGDDDKMKIEIKFELTTDDIEQIDNDLCQFEYDEEKKDDYLYNYIEIIHDDARNEHYYDYTTLGGNHFFLILNTKKLEGRLSYNGQRAAFFGACDSLIGTDVIYKDNDWHLTFLYGEVSCKIISFKIKTTQPKNLLSNIFSDSVPKGAEEKISIELDKETIYFSARPRDDTLPQLTFEWCGGKLKIAFERYIYPKSFTFDNECECTDGIVVLYDVVMQALTELTPYARQFWHLTIRELDGLTHYIIAQINSYDKSKDIRETNYCLLKTPSKSDKNRIIIDSMEYTLLKKVGEFDLHVLINSLTNLIKTHKIEKMTGYVKYRYEFD